MRIKDGLKLVGTPAEIPDCGRDDLPQFFKDMGYKVGVEIGVWQGEFSKILCSTGMKLYAVDPWKADPTLGMYGGQKNLDGAYNDAKKNLKGLSCKIIRKTSMDAVKDFKDESLDFVYIDGNHLYKYVLEDIVEWTKKIKKGGAICGHDFIFFHRPSYCEVKQAVIDYAKKNLKQWYLLGLRAKYPGLKRDKFRSWLWIK